MGLSDGVRDEPFGVEENYVERRYQVNMVLAKYAFSDEGDPMCRVSIQNLTFCAALLMGVVTIGSDRVESAEPQAHIPVKTVSQFHRTGWCWFSKTTDAPAECDYLEPGDIPLAPWDRAHRSGCLCDRCLCDRLHAHHEEKKAWHYYIRGVGPAVHERSPGRPCLW